MNFRPEPRDASPSTRTFGGSALERAVGRVGLVGDLRAWAQVAASFFARVR